MTGACSLGQAVSRDDVADGKCFFNQGRTDDGALP